jgi:glycosyl hydrolase family 113
VNCLTWAYPAFWLSNSVLNSLPALFRVVFEGYRFTWVRVSGLGVAAASGPAEAAGAAAGSRVGYGIGSWWVSPPAVALIVVTLLFVGRKRRLLSGLFVAMLGQAGLTPGYFGRAFAGRLGGPRILALVFFFAVLVLGLRWMLEGWGARTYGGRVLNLAIGFVFLPGLIWAAAAWAPFLSILGSRFFLSLTGISLIAALVTALSFRAPAHSQSLGWPAVRSPGAGWMTAILGLLLTGVIPVAARHAASAEEQARRESWQRALAAFPPAGPAQPYPKIFFQKGVSFAAEGPGGYQSEATVKMLEQLPRFGVNAVALIPYGFERRGSTDIEIGGSMETDEGLEGLARVAHALGMKVMLKPGMWTDGGGFAGDLDFPDPAARAHWFASYQRLVEHYAALATRMHADVFCIGGEFVKLSRYDADWRQVIRRARKLYPGPIVYAANFGQEFESLTFWDALDYIGLQEYYPLPDDLSTTEVVSKVESVEKKYGKPVLLTEAGFPSAAGANRKPWDDSGGRVSLDLQARCYDAIFRAFYDKPWFAGVYWWKIGSNASGGPEDLSHTPWGKPAMQVLALYYLHNKTR